MSSDNSFSSGNDSSVSDSPDSPDSPVSAYEVKIPTWSGPMELLLDLIRSSELDVLKISIERITEDYLAMIEKMKQLDVNISADFLVMGATLVRYKVRSILGDTAEEEEDIESYKEALIEQILVYEKYKQAAGRLEEVLASGPETILFKEERDETLLPSASTIVSDLKTSSETGNEARKKSLSWAEQLRLDPQWQPVSLSHLLEAFARVMDKQERVLHDDGFSHFHEKVERKLVSIRAALTGERGKKGVPMTELVADSAEPKAVPKRSDFIATFIAILELYKLAQIEARQRASFEEIFLFSNIVLQSSTGE